MISLIFYPSLAFCILNLNINLKGPFLAGFSTGILRGRLRNITVSSMINLFKTNQDMYFLEEIMCD